MHESCRPKTRAQLRLPSAALAALLVAALCGGEAPPIAAQTADTPMNIEWWHPLAAGAGVATLFLIDEPVRDFIQDNRSEGLDDIADVTKRFKDGEIYYISSAGAFVLGLATRRPKIAATGVHILAAYGLSSGMMIATKWITGRTRPSETPDDPFNFNWFDGGQNSAFPSGSAAVVFSLATTLSDAIDRTPVSVVLYTGATLNAWARLNSDRHWLSDVVLGGLYGITAAKLVNGEWTVFGFQPPAIWTDGRSMSMGYRIPLL